jgi:hypothetical protein
LPEQTPERIAQLRDIRERLVRKNPEMFAERDPDPFDGVVGSAMHLHAAKGLLYLIISATFAMALVFILAGLVLVYFGATGTSEADILGMKISSTNVGIVSIFFGVALLIVVMTKAMQRILEILKIPN